MTSKRLATVARVLLGLVFIAGPLATAFHLVPEPVLPPRAGAFMRALAESGYMLPLLWSSEIGAGILVLSPVLTLLGLVLLAPILLQQSLTKRSFILPEGFNTKRSARFS